MLLKVTNNIFDIVIHEAIQQRKQNCSRWRSVWDVVTFVLTIVIFTNGGNRCRRSQRIVYLKSGSPKTYTCIQLLLCMPYLLRYVDVEFGSHFEKRPSPRYAQFLKIPPSRILKPYVYIIQINRKTFLRKKRLRVYRDCCMCDALYCLRDGWVQYFLSKHGMSWLNPSYLIKC